MTTIFWLTCEECSLTQPMQPCEACPVVFNVRCVRPIEMSSARVLEDDSVCWEMLWIGDVYHAS